MSLRRGLDWDRWIGRAALTHAIDPSIDERQLTEDAAEPALDGHSCTLVRIGRLVRYRASDVRALENASKQGRLTPSLFANPERLRRRSR
jgi:hypothetical protein